MKNLELIFAHNMTEFDPGAEIGFIASWDLESVPETVEVRLVWNTSGKGDRDLKVVKTIRFDSPAANDQRDVTFALPWGPYSFSGKLISVIWAIELVALPGRHSMRREITVAPRGKEVVIG